MLIFSAIAPHPPILIPSIGKDSLDKITKTKKAMEKLARDFHASGPDIVIVISPHGEVSPTSFVINLCDQYEINFESFGDFTTKLAWPGDHDLMNNGKEILANKFPINVISEPNLDHGVGVPMSYLGKKLKNTTLIPISYSLLDNQTHLGFGKTLKEIISDSDKRVAVIASGDLSHCLTKDAPVPFNPAGKKFDEKLMKLIETNDVKKIANLDAEMVENAAECGLRSILILLGVLDGVNHKPKILSYESPFGVGYLVANFKLQ